MDINSNRLRLAPVLLTMAVIFYLSNQQGDSFSLPDIANIDKLLHCLLYTALGLAAFFALPRRWRQSHPFLASGAVVLFCLCYGLTDEFHQSFIPGRDSSMADVGADTLGGCLAACINQGYRMQLNARAGG